MSVYAMFFYAMSFIQFEELYSKKQFYLSEREKLGRQLKEVCFILFIYLSIHLFIYLKIPKLWL